MIFIHCNLVAYESAFESNFVSVLNSTSRFTLKIMITFNKSIYYNTYYYLC